MTRTEFQQLADIRAREAEILLRAQCWDGAYYLIGYTIECALKACIAKAFKQDDIPDKGFVSNIFSHDLTNLLKLAEVQKHMSANSPLEVNWGIVRKWSEKTRYELAKSQFDATEMFNAVTDTANGVLPWLKKYW